jgi:hypothetical protein
MMININHSSNNNILITKNNYKYNLINFNFFYTKYDNYNQLIIFKTKIEFEYLK